MRVRLTQAVLSRMQLALQATRRISLGASRLVQAISAWSVKTPDMLRPGIVVMRGSEGLRSYDYTAMHEIEYTPLRVKHMWAVLNRTYGTHKKTLYFYLFLLLRGTIVNRTKYC